MPEIMAGQTRSVSAPRRSEKTRSFASDSRQMAETQMTEHLLIFVTETSVVQTPGQRRMKELLIEAEGGDPEANKEKEKIGNNASGKI